MTTTVVVGGGATGLAAAIELAHGGGSVQVVESSPAIGGRAQSQEIEGFTFNFGPHALYANAERVLSRLGVSVKGGQPVKGLTMQVGGRVAPLPAGPASLLLSPALSASEKWRLANLLGGLRWMDAEALDSVSVSEWLDREGVDGVARDLMLATVRVTTYVHAPELLSAGVAVRQLRAATELVRYLDGGWGTIVNGLRARALELGVEIITRTRVASIDVRDGRAAGVVLRDGQRMECDAIVLTLSPKACVRVLGAHAGSEVRELASRAIPARAACLDVALRRLPRRHPSLILGTDRPIYVSIHSESARLAPEDGALISVVRYLAPGEKVTRETRKELESYLDMSQPGWREHLVEARWAPAATVMHALPEARFGGCAGRPAVDASGVVNVALAGDWVGPDHVLFDACLASALAAAAAIQAVTSVAARSSTQGETSAVELRALTSP